eukprot:EG_transcript_25439
MWYKEKKKNTGLVTSRAAPFPSSQPKLQPSLISATSTTTTTPSGVQSYLATIPDKLTKWTSPQKDVVVDGKVVGPVTRAYTTSGVASEFFHEEVVPRVIGNPQYASTSQYVVSPGSVQRYVVPASTTSSVVRAASPTPAAYRTAYPGVSASVTPEGHRVYQRVVQEPAVRSIY